MICLVRANGDGGARVNKVRRDTWANVGLVANGDVEASREGRAGAAVRNAEAMDRAAMEVRTGAAAARTLREASILSNTSVDLFCVSYRLTKGVKSKDDRKDLECELGTVMSAEWTKRCVVSVLACGVSRVDEFQFLPKRAESALLCRHHIVCVARRFDVLVSANSKSTSLPKT